MRKKKQNLFLLSSVFNAYNLKVSEHFYTWRLDIVFLIWFFETFCSKIYITKYLKQFSTLYNSNILISLDQNVSILFVNNIYFGKILEQFATWKLDIVQNLCEFCLFLVWFLSPKCPNVSKPEMCPTRQNVLIPSILKISQWAKFPNTLDFYTTVLHSNNGITFRIPPETITLHRTFEVIALKFA